MTPEEKAAQLTQYFYLQPIPAANKPALEALRTTGLGSLLFVTDPAEVNRLQRIAVEQSRLKIPLLFGFDVIHGLRTIFPVPIGMAASWDPALVEATQAVAAKEARAVGVHWTFAPNVDIARDPRWGRIVETAGEDPYLTSAMARAQVHGFQGPRLGAPGHVIAGPKHFAGYGASLGGRDWDEVELSDSDLWNVHLPPFQAAINAGAGAMMAAYMHLNGVPAAANRNLLTTILRDKLGFKGFIGSDSGSVNKLVTQNLTRDTQDAAARAIAAGLDIEMVDPGKLAAMSKLPAAMAAGQVPQARVDEAVGRILKAKLRMGLFERPYIDEKAVEKTLNDPAHRRLARIAAERSAVLLRNENGVLPFDKRRIKSLAVIGPMAASAKDTLGPWVFEQNGASAVTVLAGLQQKLGKKVRISYSEGVRMPARMFPSPSATADKVPERPPLDETTEIARAAALARDADAAVVVVGEAMNMISEGGSRSSFTLPGRQQELLDAVVATGKPVVVVIFSARPLHLGETRAQAILDAWYPGSEGGTAIANLLFGDAVPAGKLPFSWTRSPAHAPNYYAQLISHKPNPVNGRYWNETSAPTYPFGYGLSYSTFEYTNLRLQQPSVPKSALVVLNVDLKNLGDRTADEVPQLYIHQRFGTSARPARELKGFQRVTLKPGETRSLRFVLSPDDLRYWSSATNGWVNNASAFDVWVGGNSEATLHGIFELTG
ncbi:glycoside hydrolase family 3 N-terminal domain-containing protein [Novosphingobium chloroacetimidivorans]|nr:glycoside hydrolase family 3 N-terminal domain-containing protein [Novosphingobium chloroacetimidivorans]